MDNRTRNILDALAAENNLRSLPEIHTEGKYLVSAGKRYLNLSSNDYLGLAANAELQRGDDPEDIAGFYRKFIEEAAETSEFLLSNPSSRLITGNGPDYKRLESTLSELYGGRAALVLGSGYLANSGVLPAITEKGDLILADKLVHASLIDGLRLCEAEWQRFSHNDMEHLEKLIVKNRTSYHNIWVVTESVFSMDGDIAPLKEIVTLKEKYDLKIYVDEAHAFGVWGVNGRGVTSAEGCEAECDILVGTFGKAIASQGAFVISDPLTHELLVNRMRPLIFSTALPPISLRWSETIVRHLPMFERRRTHLRKLIGMLDGTSHIIPLLAGENARAIALSEKLREAGFWVTPIRYPTVPKSAARIRISLNSALDTEDIDQFIEAWKSIG